MKVEKRDGTLQEFDFQKITQAVKNVYKSIGKEGVSDCSFCTFRGDVPLICACGECWPCWSGRSP